MKRGHKLTPRLQDRQLGHAPGTNAPTIRHCEEIGLLRRANREPGGQRSYGEDEVKRLTFIRRCRAFGFPIEPVRALVAPVQDRDRSCLDARQIAEGHLTAVRTGIVELKALNARTQSRFHHRLRQRLRRRSWPDCIILDDLSRAPAAAAG